MTYSEFMTAIIEIYGKYNSDILEKITFKYIRDKFKESELQNVIEKLILVKSAKYKTPPDPAEFEEIFFKKSDADYEIEALSWYKEINKHSTRYDVIISDIRVQATLEDMGGWEAFGERDPKDEHWHQKKFVDLFKLYSTHRPENEPRLLRGGGNYDPPQPPTLIGDREACLLISQMAKVEPLKIAAEMAEGMKI